jgi:hypothetical protein
MAGGLPANAVEVALRWCNANATQDVRRSSVQRSKSYVVLAPAEAAAGSGGPVREIRSFLQKRKGTGEVHG